MKTERLLAIVVLLLSRKQVTANEMAQQFQVSKRTIYRDLVTLESAGFPIVARHGNEGGYQLMDGFKLHTYTFSEAEKSWLINVLNMQHDLLTETAMGQGILSKLRLMVMSEPLSEQVSLAQGTLHRKKIEDETKTKLTRLRRAMEEESRLEIAYVSANGQKTTRKVSPWQLRLTNGSWYLLAYCELRQEEREFKLTRIREIVVLNEKRLPPSMLVKSNSERNKQQVVCLFSPQQLGKLYDFFTDQDIKELANGDIQVSFEEEQGKNLLPFLLMFGANVRVLVPETLQRAHRQAIDDMKNSYLS